MRLVRFPANKDYSDFVGALAVSSAHGLRDGDAPTVAVVAGLLGGELDHEWANVLDAVAFVTPTPARRPAGKPTQPPPIHTLLAPCRARNRVVAVTRRGVTLGGFPPGTPFSVFATPATAAVTVRGAAWPLRGARLRGASHGLHNRTARGGPTDVAVRGGVAVVVVRAADRSNGGGDW